MTPDPSAPQTIDDYIAAHPPKVRAILKKLRATIRKAAPQAAEAIKYQIPTFVLHGNLVSFAAYKAHIGLYPAPSGSAKFNKALAAYKTEKSTVRLPLDQPVPYDLITEIVKLRVKDQRRRAAAKGKKK